VADGVADALPAPLVAADVDLKSMPFTPIFRARLFASAFHARVSDAAWRAGVTLWLKSWDQAPAGTLPDDEIELCRLAELGRDLRSWRKIKEEAMWGWIKCSDGRLHHRVVAEGVNTAWQSKESRRDRTEKARQVRLSQRPSRDSPAPVTASNRTEHNLTESPHTPREAGMRQSRRYGSPFAPRSSGGVLHNGSNDRWRTRLLAFRRTGMWVPSHGPKPGEPECEAPAELVREILGLR